MKSSGFNIFDLLIKALDNLIKGVDIALNSFYKFLDYLIKAFEEVSKKILQLIANIFRLGYYILPFIFMIILGARKGWNWMSITGWSVLILVTILFFRNFIAEFRGKIEHELEKPIIHARKIFVIVLLLNILLGGYTIAYFVGGVSIEQFIADFFQGPRSSLKANEIRETRYIQILQTENQNVQSQISEAIRRLGDLKSITAKPLLIEKLMKFRTHQSTMQSEEFNEASLIIEALARIGGAETCSTLVIFEVEAQNSQLKEKARKAADQVCGYTFQDITQK